MSPAVVPDTVSALEALGFVVGLAALLYTAAGWHEAILDRRAGRAEGMDALVALEADHQISLEAWRAVAVAACIAINVIRMGIPSAPGTGTAADDVSWLIVLVELALLAKGEAIRRHRQRFNARVREMKREMMAAAVRGGRRMGDRADGEW